MSSFNSMNKVFLLGRLGRDPEIRHTQSGVAIATFSLATSESIKKDNGWEEKTEWHNIVVFGTQAKNCDTFLHKGSLVFIEGKLQTRSFQNKEGVEKYTTEIIGYSIKFLDSKSSSNSYSKNSFSDTKKSHSDDISSTQKESFTVEEDDDLPF